MKKLLRKFFVEDNLSIVKSLFMINLLYANPQVTSNMMKKGKYRNNPDKIFSHLVYRNYAVGFLAILFIYFIFFMGIPFQKVPVFLDYILIIMVFVNIFQTFTFYFNVFYESRDVEWYMYLPLNEETVYKSKLTVIGFTTMQLSLPAIPLMIMFYERNLYHVFGPVMAGIIGLLIGIVYFMLIGALVVSVDMLIMKMLTKTALIRKFKTGIMTAINILATVVILGSIILLQTYMSSDRAKQILEGKQVYKGYISNMIMSPLGNIIFILVLSSLTVIIYRIATGKINGNFYSYIRNMQEISSENKGKKDRKKETEKKNVIKTSLSKEFFRYNRSLINDSTIIFQSIINPLIFPIVFFIPMFMKKELIFQNVPYVALGIGFSAAIIFLSSAMPYTIPSIIFSLDKENYDYLKALPIDRKWYFNKKLIFAWAIGNILPFLITIGIELFFGMDYRTVVVSIISYIILSFAISGQWAIYDYKNIMTGWQNISELFSRISRWAYIFIFFVIVMIIAFLSGLLVVVVEFVDNPVMINTVSAVIYFIIVAIMYTRIIFFIKKIK